MIKKGNIGIKNVKQVKRCYSKRIEKEYKEEENYKRRKSKETGKEKSKKFYKRIGDTTRWIVMNNKKVTRSLISFE